MKLMYTMLTELKLYIYPVAQFVKHELIKHEVNNAKVMGFIGSGNTFSLNFIHFEKCLPEA